MTLPGNSVPPHPASGRKPDLGCQENEIPHTVANAKQDWRLAVVHGVSGFREVTLPRNLIAEIIKKVAKTIKMTLKTKALFYRRSKRKERIRIPTNNGASMAVAITQGR